MKNPGVGVSTGALLIRLALGVVFVWAGLAKLLGTADYTSEQVSVLQSMGVAITPAAPPAPVTPAAPTDAGPRPPTKPLPAPVGGGSASLGRPLSRPGTTELGYTAQPPAGASGAPVRMRQLYMIAILLNSASKPSANNPKAAPLVPASIGTGSTPVILAWAAALTEAVCGAFVLVGLLARLAALALVGVMAVAAWLTSVGPAVASGSALLGFLPAAEWYEMQAFTAFLMQLTMGLMAMAVVFIGPGAMSLDALLAGGPAGGSAAKPAKSADK